MSVSSADTAPWSLIQWVLTGLITASGSSIAFVWRLARKIDRIESAQAAQSRVCDSSSAATEAGMIRLAERLQQVHDDHFRIRETISVLPSRNELRDVENRIIEQLAALAGRLDRTLDRREA